MAAGEIRRDPILGHRTIIAQNRGDRPIHNPQASACDSPSIVDDPFLLGNEDETPAERFRVGEPDGDWDVRVVPNRYPALLEDAVDPAAAADPFQIYPAVGQHEVIVECPQFEQQLAALEVNQIARVLTAWQSRLITIAEEGRFDYALIFKNSGRDAGASLPHAHSQLIAMPKGPIPIHVVRAATQRRFHRERGAALQDYVMERECQHGRAVLQTETLVAFCPFASRFSHETWIVPAGSPVPFTQLDGSVVQCLAKVLQTVLRAILSEHPGAAYNLMLHATPFSQLEEPWFRWRLEICPRLARLAGFELATGMFLNTVPPEHAAASLRERIEQAAAD